MDRLRLVLLAALAMSVGWGFRGDYGHETGAILPGALLGLALVMASRRPDWLGRGTLVAFFCGLGWAIGGQMSYGLVIGYTMNSSLGEVAYGFASLFLIGALWGAVGAAALAVSLTWRRSELEQFTWPLVAIGAVWLALDLSGWTDRLSTSDAPGLAGRWAPFDVDWLAAASALGIALVCLALPGLRRAATVLAIMAAGWLAGFVVLVDLAGLRMTPPRSDNWAGCVGLVAALVGWLAVTRQRAALSLVGVGLLSGGFGFAVGNLWQPIGRAKWGPFETSELLANLNYWKCMEQSFGLIMGFGMALGALVLLQGRLAPPEEDRPRGPLHLVGLIFLFVVMPWTTLGQNVGDYYQRGWLPDEFLGVSTGWWLLASASLVAAIPIFAAWLHQRGKLPMAPASQLGRAQWLFLLLLWLCLAGDFARVLPELTRPSVFFVHLSFWFTAGVASLLVLSIGEPPVGAPTPGQGSPRSASDTYWRPSWPQATLWLCVPLVIFALAWLSTNSHDEPLPGARTRFEQPAEPTPN